jgi:hypothetical protein
VKCAQARRLFGACWDDETTQAEREWLEAHLASCPACRREYEEFSRAIELLGSLPRVEPAPELLERVLSRTRRSSAAPDRFPVATRPWIPVTAAAALLAIAAMMIAPWLGLVPGTRRLASTPQPVAIRQPELVQRVGLQGGVPAEGTAPRPAAVQPEYAGSGQVAGVPDSLFDHGEDFEFILDPVTLHRGRATVTRLPAGVQGEKAVISF